MASPPSSSPRKRRHLSTEVVSLLNDFLRERNYQTQWYYKVLSSVESSDRNVQIGLVRASFSSAIVDPTSGAVKQEASKIMSGFAMHLRASLKNSHKFTIRGSSRGWKSDPDVLFVLFVKRKTIDDNPLVSALSILGVGGLVVLLIYLVISFLNVFLKGMLLL